MRSLLQPLLLFLIHERPGHGYDLVERLGDLGVTDVEPGQVYRTLRTLERDRSVASSWVTPVAGPARRRYELTPDGLATLAVSMTRLDQLHQTVGGCLARWTEVPGTTVAPAVRRTT